MIKKKWKTIISPQLTGAILAQGFSPVQQSSHLMELKKENGKVYLLLFTIIYCVITQVLNIDYGPAMGIYLIGLGLVKGFFSEELKDVFNFQKTKVLYEKNGLKDSLMDLLSLILIFINSYLIDYEPFTLFEFIFISFVIAFTFRFIFWGITRTIRGKFNPEA